MLIVLRLLLVSNIESILRVTFTILLRVAMQICYKKSYLRPFVGNDFSIHHHWSSVRDRRTENFKNDIAWLLTLRGTKIRDSLKAWGYC